MDLLTITGLSISFPAPAGPVRAVDNFSLSIAPKRVLGLVGESGCGKTVTALSILRLVPPPGRIDSGRILFEGRDLLAASEEEMRAVRGARISMIFQEPMTALNPVFTVGDQIAETLRVHQAQGRREAWDGATALLQAVGIPSPEKRVREYPHQLSGGMRQRVVIAMAIACRPSLILADEPTTALDVTIQAHILELLARLQEEMGMAMVLITHDMGLIAERSHEVAVMYAGRIVEQAGTRELFADPLHPYTQGLLASIPRPGDTRARRLRTISGAVPRLSDLPVGCAFQPRCDRKTEQCRTMPELVEAASGHFVRCWHPGDANRGRAAVQKKPGALTAGNKSRKSRHKGEEP